MTKKDMNFRIIENPKPEYEEDYEKFVRLYNSGNYKVADIKEELGWTQGIYNRAYHKAKSEGLLNKSNLRYLNPSDKPLVPKAPKYFTRLGKKWVVGRQLNKQKLYFGKFETEIEARLAVSYFNENGWNKAKACDVKHKVKEDLQTIKRMS